MAQRGTPHDCVCVDFYYAEFNGNFRTECDLYVPKVAKWRLQMVVEKFLDWSKFSSVCRRWNDLLHGIAFGLENHLR